MKAFDKLGKRRTYRGGGGGVEEARGEERADEEEGDDEEDGGGASWGLDEGPADRVREMTENPRSIPHVPL